MAFVKTTAGRNACASGGWLAACNGGSVKVYTTGHGTLLATFPLLTPSFTGPVTGVLTLNGPPIVATPVANGTAAVYDICDSGDVPLGSGVVTDTSGSGDIKFNNINFVTTSPVTLSTLTHTEPAS
jgi:hypothetical protein